MPSSRMNEEGPGAVKATDAELPPVEPGGFALLDLPLRRPGKSRTGTLWMRAERRLSCAAAPPFSIDMAGMRELIALIWPNVGLLTKLHETVEY